MQGAPDPAHWRGLYGTIAAFDLSSLTTNGDERRIWVALAEVAEEGRAERQVHEGHAIVDCDLGLIAYDANYWWDPDGLPARFLAAWPGAPSFPVTASAPLRGTRTDWLVALVCEERFEEFARRIVREVLYQRGHPGKHDPDNESQIEALRNRFKAAGLSLVGRPPLWW